MPESAVERRLAPWAMLLLLALLVPAAAVAEGDEHEACDAKGRRVVTFTLPGFTAVPGLAAGYGNVKSEDAEVTWNVRTDPDVRALFEKSLAREKERLAAGRITDFESLEIPGAVGAYSYYDTEADEVPVWILDVFAPSGLLHLGASAFEWKPGDPKARGQKVLQQIVRTAKAY